jgi:predicted esterase
MGPDATKEKPERLIIWLHPSGGSMNEIVEKLAPRFNKDGCALLVLTQKNWSYWNRDEGDQLMEHTLPEVAKIDGIDASRPILFGFSAGGQMALEMYEKAPAKFGGLVLDAAYPFIPMQVDGLSIRRPPKDDAIQKVPIFVIVGERDGGARIWKEAEPIWRGAGVPLVVHFIPEKVHQWLFGPEQLDELDKWLKEVGEGKLPGAAQPPQPPAIKAEAPCEVAAR